MTGLPSADQCVQIFHAALAAHDMQGVEAALTVLAVQDPHRAADLIETTRTALVIADAADIEET